jgi:hypothetical protein
MFEPMNLRITLQRLLWIDGFAGLTAGLFLLLFRTSLPAWLGLPQWLITLQCTCNFLYAAYALNLANRAQKPTWMLWTLVFGNWAYALFALILLLYFYPGYTALGAAFFIAEVVFIGGIGVVEAVKIRNRS